MRRPDFGAPKMGDEINSCQAANDSLQVCSHRYRSTSRLMRFVSQWVGLLKMLPAIIIFLVRKWTSSHICKTTIWTFRHIAGWILICTIVIGPKHEHPKRTKRGFLNRKSSQWKSPRRTRRLAPHHASRSLRTTLYGLYINYHDIELFCR